MAETEVQGLKNDVSHLRSDLGSLASTVRGLLAERGSAIYATARERGVRAEQSAERAIAQRPMASIAGVFAVGVILGMAMRWRG